MTDYYTPFEPDPVLGAYVAHYPSNRLRLLVRAGIPVLVVWFVVTVAFWQVEDTTARLATTITIFITTLVAGWYILHLWNREVVLYERGFSYVEGSLTAFIAYADIDRIRQRGERIAYFGGLVRRTVYRVTLWTHEGETITLTNLYNRVPELGARLEAAVLAAKRPAVEQALTRGERVAFGGVTVSADGIHANGRDLLWRDFGGVAVGGGHLSLQNGGGEDWARVPLADVENAALLLVVLKARARE